MTIGFINRLGGLTEIMKVTELVWHLGEHLRDGTADGQLAVRNDADNRHLYGLTYCLEQNGEVRLGRREQTTGEENFPGETVTEDPQHLMADIRLETVES